MCIYDYKVNKRNGEKLPLSNYKINQISNGTSLNSWLIEMGK